MALLKEDKEALLKLRPTLTELRRIRGLRDYAAIRKKYFGSTIPDVSEVSILFVSGKRIGKTAKEDHLLGCLRYAPDMLGANICIDEASPDATYLMTLVHEMAHLKVEGKWKRDMGHGKHWQAEMQRLARLGAFKPLW